jgi:hypothetical protein
MAASSTFCLSSNVAPGNALTTSSTPRHPFRFAAGPFPPSPFVEAPAGASAVCTNRTLSGA